jgi:hypothetical protein
MVHDRNSTRRTVAFFPHGGRFSGPDEFSNRPSGNGCAGVDDSRGRGRAGLPAGLGVGFLVRVLSEPPDGRRRPSNFGDANRAALLPTGLSGIEPKLATRVFAFFNLVKGFGWPGLEPLWAKPRRFACGRRTGASLRSSPGHPSFNRAKAQARDNSRLESPGEMDTLGFHRACVISGCEPRFAVGVRVGVVLAVRMRGFRGMSAMVL